MAKLPFDIPPGLSFNSIDEANAYFQKQMEVQNNSPRDNFDGLSPTQMRRLIGPNNMEINGVRINNLTPEELTRIPVFSIMKYYFKLLNEKEIKLSAKGNLPSNVVRKIYDQGYYEEWTCKRKTRLLEDDSLTIQLVRILANICKWTKVRNGKLSLTKEGLKIQQDENRWFQEMMYMWLYRFNWAYFDGYSREDTARANFEFSFYLIKKYGHEFRSYVFYAKKYYEAFPTLDTEEQNIRYKDERFNTSFNCYKSRTFVRLLAYLNVVELEGNEWFGDLEVKKTDLFDKVFSIEF